MEADSPLGRSPGIIVLNPEAPENPGAAVVHANGDRDVVLPKGEAQKIPYRLFQLEDVRHLIELLLGHVKWIVGCFCHHYFLYLAFKQYFKSYLNFITVGALCQGFGSPFENLING
jgi:hypothetical protein